MFPIFINPTSVLISISAMFGIVVHDSQLFKITNLASLAAVDSVSIQSSDIALLDKSSQHIHVAVASPSTVDSGPQIAIQPRNENDKKYLSSRKTTTNNDDSDYFWPSP